MNNNNAIKPRQWTPEQRARQAQRIREYKPWIKSTGPKTIEGKKKSSRNAYKHGCYGAEIKAIFSYLAASRLLIKTLARKRKEYETAAREARRAAKAGPQKVLHITCDAPIAPYSVLPTPYSEPSTQTRVPRTCLPSTRLTA